MPISAKVNSSSAHFVAKVNDLAAARLLKLPLDCHHPLIYSCNYHVLARLSQHNTVCLFNTAESSKFTFYNQISTTSLFSRSHFFLGSLNQAQRVDGTAINVICFSELQSGPYKLRFAGSQTSEGSKKLVMNKYDATFSSSPYQVGKGKCTD